MSSHVSIAPRQGLNARQAETVDRLLRAGQAVLEEVGPEELTIRTVAARAGVSPATAYTYLASKNHLFAEIYLRHVIDNPGPVVDGGPTQRLSAVVRHLAETLLATAHLAAAANTALLASDPEVDRLRLAIGNEFWRRFSGALGEATDPDVMDAVMFAFSGALLQAGMGLLDTDNTLVRLDRVVEIATRGLA
ncbi:MAG: TetR/AcrR family transcriptional regulator [Nocardioides sp.]|uniref:TetR/AcrR family transcriptional regulator n=1 Tax=Nocardioides sp. TaxID=35761 RepID=UPI003F0A0F3E